MNSKALWAIPILILLYVGVANLYPGIVASPIDTSVDVGGQGDMAENLKLTGPEDRISGPLNNSDISYREFGVNGEGLVYFSLDDPMLETMESVRVNVTFKEPSGPVKVGLKNDIDEWSYGWKKFYSPPETNGKVPNVILEEDDLSLVAVRGSKKQRDFNSIRELLEDSDYGTTIALDRDVEIEGAGTRTEFNYSKETQNQEVLKGESSLEVRTPLRGGHTFHVLVRNDTFRLTVGKQDLNWYDNADDLTVKLSRDGSVVHSITIPDDGEVNDTKTVGPVQNSTLEISDIETGVYEVTLQSNSDLLIRKILLNQPGLVVKGKPYIGGSNYAKAIDGTSYFLYTRTGEDTFLNFKTWHGYGKQSIHITNHSGFWEEIQIDEEKKLFWTMLPGSEDLFKIMLGKGDLKLWPGDQVSNHALYYSFTPESYFDPDDPALRKKQEGKGFALRGKHTFLTYVENSTLKLDVSKQDLNWYNGSDDLKIEITNSSNEVVGGTVIRDDGILDDSKQLGRLQKARIQIPNLPEGVYKIRMKGEGDLLIRDINTSSKLIVKDPFIADASYYNKPGQEVSLYTSHIGNISFRTYHGRGKQKVALGNKTVNIDEVKKLFTYNIGGRGLKKVKLERGDLIVKMDGYFGFEPRQYFAPRPRTLSVSSLTKARNKGADYFITTKKLETQEDAENHEWITKSATWNLSSYVITDNNKLSICINYEAASTNSTLKVSRVEVFAK